MRTTRCALGTLAVIGFGSFVAASLTVGLRLLAIAMRTGKTPEMAIGTAFFAGGGIGHGLIVLAYALRVFPPGLTPIAVLVGNTALSVGAIALAVGIRSVFRPIDRWPLAVTLAIVTLLLISLVGRLIHIAEMPAPAWVFWCFTIGSGASYAWSALESLHFHAMLRRRMRIGLADAWTARRFLLWGMAGSAGFAIHLCSAANRLIDGATIPLPMVLVQALLGLSAAIGIWLAFFPPKWLVQRATG